MPTVALSIQFLDTASGQVSTLVTPDKPSQEFTVSPDDTYVVWIEYGRTSCDLMVVEGLR